MSGTTAYHYGMIKDLEQRAELCGMRLRPCDSNWSTPHGTTLALVTHGEHLPVYRRDIELAVGTAEQLEMFIKGWEKQLSYLSMIGATSDRIIKRKEQDYRNRELARLIKTGKKTNDE